MTVNTTNIISGPYAGNDIADTFSYTFRVKDKTQLSVYETDNAGVQTLLVVDTDYTVTSVGVDAGGTIVRTAGALPTNYTWYIRSNYIENQLTAFPSQGPFFPDVHENQMDHITFLIQQLRDLVNRTFRLADNIDIDGIFTIGQNAANRVGKFLTFDSVGDLQASSGPQLASVDSIFDNVALMKAESLPTGVTVQTRGYYAAGDLGNANYLIVAPQSFDGYGDHQLTNGNIAVLQTNGEYNLKQFGAKGDSDGTTGNGTDDSASLGAAIDALGTSGTLFIPKSSGIYRIVTGKTLSNGFDGITIYGNAALMSDGGQNIMAFGPIQESPDCSNLSISGLTFQQPASLNNVGQFIRVSGVDNFQIRDCELKSAGNGGIYVTWGAKNGTITNIKCSGTSAYVVQRCIWVAGDHATDYAAQLMDTSTLQRNATPYPTNDTPKNIRITNVETRDCQYGIYLINARRVTIDRCDVEGESRCIAVNNYSPDTRISNCTLKDVSNTSGTGILITQFSSPVFVDNCYFKGSFAGNRGIYVQYGAYARITGCTFTDIGTQNIQVNHNGVAVIERCDFAAHPDTATAGGANRAIHWEAVDADSPTHGATATSVRGLTVKNCTFGQVDTGISMINWLGNSVNPIDVEECTFEDNVILDRADYAASGASLLFVDFSTATSTLPLIFKGNRLDGDNSHANAAGKHKVITGSGTVTDVASDVFTSLFHVSNVAGTYTVTKQAGDKMTLVASLSGTDTLLTPRLKASGVPLLSEIIPGSANINYAKVQDYTQVNPILKFYNLADVEQLSNVETFDFYVKLTSKVSNDV